MNHLMELLGHEISIFLNKKGKNALNLYILLFMRYSDGKFLYYLLSTIFEAINIKLSS